MAEEIFTKSKSATRRQSNNMPAAIRSVPRGSTVKFFLHLNIVLRRILNKTTKERKKERKKERNMAGFYFCH